MIFLKSLDKRPFTNKEKVTYHKTNACLKREKPRHSLNKYQNYIQEGHSG